ncbi:GerAB/ArcD/ProY family transporter [Paenibacillus qinlingensis]|uniref:GerAB/ArcD/ProY family transporter n=1 Tax=Paenibacillus qinlingensis TaxID=1837343 RepID=UPI0015678BA2|nr:endospore germination permease [Paenibacillus qinlingensis]NQX64039.1 endospore germination permease [Paenibacillus qinlingensis]
MTEHGKISAGQAAALLYLSIISTALLYLPNITAKSAGNDLWLSPIIGSIAGFLLVFITCKLAKKYPNQTFMQYLPAIIGSLPAKILGFLYIISLLNMSGAVLRSYTELMLNAFLRMTPKGVIIYSMLIICAYAVRSGLEIIGRAAQLFMPVVIISLIFIVALLWKDYNVMDMLPILENGLLPAIKGSIHSMTWISEFFFMSFLIPYIYDVDSISKWSTRSVIWVVATMSGMNLFVLWLLGSSLETFLYPILAAARYVSVADFLENIESLIVIIWVIGLFIKISLFYYVTVMAITNWLRLQNYRAIVLPTGLLIALFSLWGIPNLPSLVSRSSGGGDFNDLFFRLVCPGILLILAAIRSIPTKKGGMGTNDRLFEHKDPAHPNG